MPATEQLAISFPEAVIVLVSDGDQEFFAHDKMDPWERGWTAGNILHSMRTASDLSAKHGGFDPAHFMLCRDKCHLGKISQSGQPSKFNAYA